MNKKNFDKLFQEKLKDFQEIPDEKVWRSIEHSLDQRKQRRRVIPLWWKLGGAAAILIIGLLLINPFSSSEIPETIITDVEKTDPPVQNDVVVDPDADHEDVPGELKDGMTNSDKNNSLPDLEETQDNESSPDPNGLTIVPEPDRELDATNETVVNVADDNEVVDGEDKGVSQQIVVADDSINEEDEARVGNQDKKLEAKDQQLIAESTNQENKEDPESTDEIMEKTNKAIAEQTQESEMDDSSGKKSIFDEINKQEEEDALAESSDPKWSVGPSVAPVYFDSFGEGSPIHSSFTSNSKSGNVNFSYGIGVAYDISKKLSIRSGVHKVDYGYDTNDITFSSSLVASTSTEITNIDYTNTSKNLVVENSNVTDPTQDFAANDIIAQSPSRNGRMVQEFGYLEVPMELNYALLDRKLNIDIIGGFSSLFLINNSVTLESSGTSTEMGEANNLNDVNFSTNVGLGINYELSDKMKVHLEPMFKYQMNMFSDTEGSFQPYTVGVYTGLSFKF